MNRILSLLALIILSGFTTLSQAQQKNGKIEGSVIDENQKVIEAATVTLLRAKDSSVVKIAVADKGGNFQIDGTAEGKYLVSVTGVGYNKSFTQSFEVSATNTTINLKTITLIAQSKSLGGVTVTAKKPLVETKIDRTVVNVEAAVTNAGSSAIEVLEKSPGITVDKDGNISLKGKEGVIVLVDGRPTQLSGPDLANMLRSMHASQLDQIEIMTNPPAKFDAAGNAGVINIKTKKTQTFGYNGTVTLGYGQSKYPKANEALNFNYRNGKINLFTNLSHNYRKGANQLNLQRHFRNESTKELMSHFDQQAKMHSEFNSFNAKLGLDYAPNKKTTFGIVLNGYSNPGTFGNRNHILKTNANGEPVSQTKALVNYDQSWNNFSTNLNFRRNLDTTGREITADLDYITYNSSNDQVLSNYYYDAAGNATNKADTLLGALPQDIKIYSGRVDYLHPLKKGARFEAGLKSSIVRTDNNARYDSILYGEVVNDINRTNHFIYEENINAAYVNLSTPLSKKISAQLGLRLENTIAKGNQVTSGTTFDRNYTHLFPTAYFQYAANEKNNFGLNYGKRIRRPNYESLNPFIRFLDRYTYMSGNPELKPQFSHNIELSHTYNKFLTTTLNYTYTNDIITQVFEQNTEKNETFVKQSNLAKQRQFGISVNANHPVTKWWTNSIYVNVFNNRFDGVIDTTNVTVKATMLMLNGSQQFKFAKTWTAELSGFYRTAGIESVIKTSPMGMLSVGLSKQVMKNKGTLRLNVRDILYSQKFRGVSKYGDIDASFQEQRDSRVVNLGFTYRFSKGKMNGGQKKRTSGSANDEQSRVGGGSGN